MLAGAVMGLGPSEAFAAFINARGGRDVVIGPDNDNLANPLIQPAGTAANQSLNNTDIQRGGGGNDVLIGLLGSDVQLGEGGDDILVGGTEQGVTPNSDIQFGGPGDDVSIWAPGDGSDFFEGGPGRDAQVFGVIDRDANNVPTLTGHAPGFPHGIPTANVTGSPGFCTLEQVPAESGLGYEFLVRFFVRATGALAVTIRLVEVEQVFCTSQAGGQVIFADLRRAQPQFEVVSLDRVERLNPLVRRIIR
jgi:Ca2+-binding RTX toxin-like protein